MSTGSALPATPTTASSVAQAVFEETALTGPAIRREMQRMQQRRFELAGLHEKLTREQSGLTETIQNAECEIADLDEIILGFYRMLPYYETPADGAEAIANV